MANVWIEYEIIMLNKHLSSKPANRSTTPAQASGVTDKYPPART